MAQATVTATSTWQQIAIGAVEVLVQNQGPQGIRVAKQATVPVSDDVGTILWPPGYNRKGEREYDLALGTDNLYVRSVAQTSRVEVTT